MAKKTSSEKTASETASAEKAAAAVAEAAPTASEGGEAAAAGIDYKAQYEAANERWLRSRAEFDNYRKRVLREATETRSQAVRQTVNEFLGVHDQLSIALVHARAAGAADGFLQGLELIMAEFERVLSGLGVTRVPGVGQPFDPAVHEAISQEASAEVPSGAVLHEVKAGFVLGERLLRPATVVVSTGPAAAVRSAASADKD